MSTLEVSHRGRAFAAMLLSLVLGTSVAQPAPADGLAAGKKNAPATAPRVAAPASVRVSPHALAARQRAAAQAAAAASGITPFTVRRRPPHSHLVGGR